MTQRLKRWESPRREGRNHKGRGGTAKQRQYVKRQKLWRQRLTDSSPQANESSRQSSQRNQKRNQKGEVSRLSSFLAIF
ncbi:hypothetical protein IQ241_12275 [Romeria aff. gracilis LEGE 07310]|uniref:Uncharacterized protein n=1 Tax=Vasconcelosia minhoensis LEGE 07310 TaxID=915328 RepID=A0A8J7AI83_9CYAN|nr:hypothetical protein [Romeria gracilis]MBE9078058.1 hypothetical protein [Romeria aff. gracilis LEGE 07310]